MSAISGHSRSKVVMAASVLTNKSLCKSSGCKRDLDDCKCAPTQLMAITLSMHVNSDKGLSVLEHCWHG